MAENACREPEILRRDLLSIGVAVAASACALDERSNRPIVDAGVSEVADASALDAAPDVPSLDATPDVPSPDAASDAVASDAAPDAVALDAPLSDVVALDAPPDLITLDITDDPPPPDLVAPDAASTDDGPMDVALDAEASIDTNTAEAGPPCPPDGATLLGPLSAFASGSWRSVKAARVIVGRDARGIFAYSSVCTHAGCTIPAPDSAMTASTCPCHGARYDADGTVLSGPAPASLTNFEIVLCGGDVYANLTRMVPIGTRTPTP